MLAAAAECMTREFANSFAPQAIRTCSWSWTFPSQRT